MSDGASPTVRRRRLGLELRRLREAAGLTHETAVARLKEEGGAWSRAKMTRIEGAHWKRPSIRDVRDMLDAYGVTDDEVREAMLELAKEARKRGWWATYEDVLPSAFVGLEAEAAEIKAIEPMFVPGLLQTEEYARAIFRAENFGAAEEEIERRVAARLERQAILERDGPPELSIVVDEGALRRQVGGPTVMRAQLDRLIEAGRRPNVSIQVMPATRGAYAGMGSLSEVFHFSDLRDPPIACYDGPGAATLFVDTPDEVKLAIRTFERASAKAEGSDESIPLIRSIRDAIPYDAAHAESRSDSRSVAQEQPQLRKGNLHRGRRPG